MKILVEKIYDNNELIGRSYHFAPEIYGIVILSIKASNDLNNYIGKFVEANIFLMINMICKERLSKFCIFLN